VVRVVDRGGEVFHHLLLGVVANSYRSFDKELGHDCLLGFGIQGTA
jgi:hypothetical protein